MMTQDQAEPEAPDLIDFLTRWRRTENLSAKEMAAMLGWRSATAESMIYAYESGRSEIGARYLGRILRAFGTTAAAQRMVIKYLLKLSDLPPLGGQGPRRPRVARQRVEAQPQKRSSNGPT